MTKIAGRLLLSPFFRIRTEGLAHLPKGGAFLLLPKHQRWEDVPLLGLAVPKSLYYVAKHELFRSPLSSWFMTSLGGIPLNRWRPLESRRSMRAVIDLLRKGEGVVIFPEGTYFKDGMGAGRRGLLRMIRKRVDVPCIPVGIRYADKGGRRLVRIAFGAPVRAEPGGEETHFLNRIMQEISRLSEMESPVTG
ncbi:MAG: 1-acyl-sn-glycerol-3-phosphate acyltransferase [Deltaproteobacteria bacterium]|nr:1-acyl-sn-glycerol-3-phosphate acyltransferase [Deltaproteobacteria bacterium]